MPYTKPTLVGYNASPPSDDGAQTAMNRVDWAKHIEKIGNPLRAYADAINNGVDTALTAVITHKNTAYVSAEVTVSTVAPSGGADGDIWLVVA